VFNAVTAVDLRSVLGVTLPHSPYSANRTTVDDVFGTFGHKWLTQAVKVTGLGPLPADSQNGLDRQFRPTLAIGGDGGFDKGHAAQAFVYTLDQTAAAFAPH
jgi:hypothetical protein